PIDQTVKGMCALGADVKIERGALYVNAAGLCGSEVYLDMPSVGATINTILTAVGARGNTTIYNGAKEPHIVDLANFLNSMGARVKGAGTDVIRVIGGRTLRGSTYAVIPDQIETGTLMIAAAATGGDVVITGAIPTHMEALSAKLLEMGVYVGEDDDRIHIRSDGNLRAVNIKTQAYPGFPTDLQQPMAALLATANGSSTITETIFESRFKYVEELKRMGADIRVFGRTAVVDGIDRLIGAPVTATDLRAGAAMIVAALMADGTTEISGVNYIMRGYEDIDRKLRGLGAKVEILSHS
ncbi:MAG: UDP-N-acetylglucosamine 1-carboxyvinyltransferase, partial [Clostridia bacterium]